MVLYVVLVKSALGSHLFSFEVDQHARINLEDAAAGTIV